MSPDHDTGHPDDRPVLGLLIPADPTTSVSVVDLNQGSGESLGALQGHVGGLIDVVAHDEGDIWINGEGRMIDLPINVRVNHWMLHESRAGGEGLVGESSMVYGNVVLTGPPDNAGDLTSVDPQLVTRIQSLNLSPDALKDWDVRTTDVTIQVWTTDSDFGL